jgi:hypothetical protein
MLASGFIDQQMAAPKIGLDKLALEEGARYPAAGSDARKRRNPAVPRGA